MAIFSDLASNAAADVIASVCFGVFTVFVIWLRKQLKGVTQMTKDWSGEVARPGISDGVPGVMQRLYAQDQQFKAVMERLGRQGSMLTEIQHEINYNSGSSIKDAVHRTDKAVKELAEDVNGIKARLEAK